MLLFERNELRKERDFLLRLIESVIFSVICVYGQFYR